MEEFPNIDFNRLSRAIDGVISQQSPEYQITRQSFLAYYDASGILELDTGEIQDILMHGGFRQTPECKNNREWTKEIEHRIEQTIFCGDETTEDAWRWAIDAMKEQAFSNIPEKLPE